MTYLADQLRAIAERSTQEARTELQALAAQVERMEIALDDIVGRARCGDPKLARMFGL